VANFIKEKFIVFNLVIHHFFNFKESKYALIFV